jgi:hypothetical protein
MLTMQEADGLLSTNSDGSYKAKPMNIHLWRFKGFLMYYNKKCRGLSTTLNDEDVSSITKMELFDYMGSPEYHDGIAEGLSKSTKATASANHKEFTAADFLKGTKREKTCYSEMKDDKHFNIWNLGFVSYLESWFCVDCLHTSYTIGPRRELQTQDRNRKGGVSGNSILHVLCL